MLIMERAREYLEQVKGLTREACRTLYDNLPKEVQAEARRLEKAAFFVPENADVENRRERLSPSGAYKLVVTPYKTGPGSWSYSQGLVYRNDSDQPIAEVQRNYSAFPHAWVEGHAKGDFLLCGENYQGQTVINLQTGGRRDHLPGSASIGAGFCWASMYPSPSGKRLAVSGCFWGAPYEVRFYDFSEPMLPPWPLISTGGSLDEFFGWVDDERANIGGYEEVYTPLGKSENELYAARKRGELTEEEHDKYLEDSDNWKEAKVNERVWICPTPLESLREYVTEYVPWRQERGQKVYPELNHNTRILLARLSDAERREYETSPMKDLVDWAFAHEEAA